MLHHEKLIDLLSFTIYPDMLSLAQKQWLTISEHAHSASGLYEERSDAFLEWYALEWNYTTDKTPIDMLSINPAVSLSEEQKKLTTALRFSYRSLFQIQAITSGGVLLLDLWGRGRYYITERRRLIGLTIGDIFEARVLPNPDGSPSLIFSNTFLLHPNEVQTTIALMLQKETSHGYDAKTKFLGKLQRFRIRCDDYKHISPTKIYTLS